MKLKTPFLLMAGALALAGCSTPTKVDHGPIRAKTFSFMDPGPRSAPAYADNAQQIHAVIQQAITRNLASRGVSKVASGGDVTVGYLLIIGNNATTTSIDEYFGYRDDSAALADKAHRAYSGNDNPNYFEAGTLVIDIIDSTSHKLLKRGYATRPIPKTTTEGARAARVQEAVDEILANLRIQA